MHFLQRIFQRQKRVWHDHQQIHSRRNAALPETDDAVGMKWCFAINSGLQIIYNINDIVLIIKSP